ncbi:hypothetical protein [Streptomyces albipurpureus]|uniref:DUF3291 domain-containing protein n=1 Tax=Streptomyces albipurpureus TaxID=2897419 RepID=A0ABT0UTR3_9ACTN|nr:hypothetical protein [Streptomyces sp. CWNU-1]MCM2391953.1 hypothetical protein [Streptomyces sp. CWNU-1]
MLRSTWAPGQVPDHDGPVLVSVTDFRLDRARDLPGVHRAARRLVAHWPELEGTHGLWLWAAPTARRCGAVAVWRDADALHRFIAWPPHAVIMREYRGRGTLASTTWEAERFDPAATWARARAVLRAGSPSGPNTAACQRLPSPWRQPGPYA